MGRLVRDDLVVEVNNEILKYLEPTDNVMLSEISSSDKVYMMMLLKKYYLTLRDRLGILQHLTFGLEIEFENAMIDPIKEYVSERFKSGSWDIVPDGSLSNGSEINSPILNDSTYAWSDLSSICDVVDKNAYVMDNTSGHIHIGTHILGNNPKYWRNFAILWATYENVIFRFLYGEYVSPRSGICGYASPVSKDFIEKMEKIEDRSTMQNANAMFRVFDTGEEVVKIRRRKSVNFTNISRLQPYIYNWPYEMNTVEFRSPNGTFNPVIWQNNVNLIMKMMLYCKSDKFNDELVFRRMKQIECDNIPSSIGKYSRIYMEQAIELADMIFDNNLDKIYFLRQYVKDGSVSNNSLVKSRVFTRK